MSAIGVAVSISGFVALVTSQSVKAWVKSHPYPIYLALIVAVLIIAGTLDYAYNLRKRITRPSDHDKKFYVAALERLPPNGAVIGWLKHTEMTAVSVDGFPADVLGALEKTIGFSRMRPVGFDDARIAGSFKSLTDSMVSFRQSVDRWTLAVQARQFGGTGSSLTAETAALTRRHHDLVRAYDRFIRTCHARGINIDA